MKKYFINILMVFLLTILVASCVKERLEPLSKEMTKQIALLPQDADVIGYVNYQQIRESSFFNMLLDSAKKHPFHIHNDEYQEFIEATGFDFKNDIHELYIAAKLDGQKDSKKGLIIAVGNYDSKKIMDYISQKDDKNKLTKEKFLDLELYRIKNEDKVFCFADEKTLVGGKEEFVKSWLENSRKSSMESVIDPALLSRIKRLKYKEDVWFTMDLKHLLENIEENKAAKKFKGIKNLQTVNFSFKAADDLNFFSESEFSDPEKADLFKDVVKGFISAVKFSLSDDRETVDILSKVDVETKTNTLLINFQMTKTDIEKLIEQKSSLTSKII
jgi:hypothetical protein